MLKPFSGTILAVYGSLILSACGNSSTGPHAPSPAQIARHIDSLMIATRNGSRFELLFVALDGPAEGVAPITVSVTTASGPQQWQGYILKYAGSVASADSNFDLIAYSDYALTNVLWVEKRYFSAQERHDGRQPAHGYHDPDFSGFRYHDRDDGIHWRFLPTRVRSR